MPSKSWEDRDPWAKKYAVGLNRWLRENGMTGAELASELGIPHHKWEHAAAGNTITLTEYYCRVKCRTNIPELDLFSIPDLRRGKTSIRRALTPEEWEQWLAENGKTYGSHFNNFSMSGNSVHDNAQVDSLFSELSNIVMSVLDSGEGSIYAFSMIHGTKIARLLQYLSIFRLNSAEDRRAAIEAAREYGKK